MCKCTVLRVLRDSLLHTWTMYWTFPHASLGFETSLKWKAHTRQQFVCKMVLWLTPLTLPQHRVMKSQDPKPTPWASRCTFRPREQTVLDLRGCTSTSASWQPPKTLLQILNIQSSTTKGKDVKCFSFKNAHISQWFEVNMHVLSKCSCMIDGKVTVLSKFLTGASKMVQKFSVGSLIFKDTASTLSTQVL